jgi:hypothetical protein
LRSAGGVDDILALYGQITDAEDALDLHEQPMLSLLPVNEIDRCIPGTTAKGSSRPVQAG